MMKHIKILLFLLLLGAGTQAQQFINTDSIKSYIDKYINNNATTAFQNKRLNTALKGLANLLDSVDARVVGGVRTVDSLWKYNDSTLAFRIKGQTYTVTGIGGGSGGIAFSGISHDQTLTGIGTPGSPSRVDTSAGKIATKYDLRRLADSITFVKDTIKFSRSITTRVQGTDTLVELVGDQQSPGPNKVYGTDVNGLKGYQPLIPNNASITQVPGYVILENSNGIGDTIHTVTPFQAGVVLPVDYGIWNAKVGQQQLSDTAAALRALVGSGGGGGGGPETDPIYIAQKSGLVQTALTYTNPSWIVSLPWTKITGTSGVITDIGSYSNPSWITALDNSKITGLSALLAGKSDVTHNHSLDALTNVSSTGKATGDLLQWNSGTSQWVKKTPDWMTQAAGDLRWTLLGHTHDATAITTGAFNALRYGAGTIPPSSINAINGGTSSYVLSYGNGWVPQTAGIADGDKGDITTSASTGWTIDAGVVSLAKMANVSTSTILGRVTAGTGSPEALTGTQTTSLLDVFSSSLKGLAPASGGGTTNFLRADGTWAAPAGGVTDGDKGDITVSSSGTAWSIDAASITTAKLAVQATNTFIGRITAGTSTPEILTATQATSILNTFSSSLKGLAPASGGGTTNFLRADGTWAAPAGGGGGTPGGSSTQVQLNVGSAFVGDPSFTFDTATNILAVPTLKLSPVVSYLAPTSITAVGNSITVGLNASPQTDSGYIYRLGANMGLTVTNYAVGGRGIWEAARAHYANVAVNNTSMTVVMAAFNDLRRGGLGYKTVRKILNGHKAIFANHFLKSYKSASDAAITKYGSWSTYTASAVGGKSTGTNARYTGTVNDSAVYVFTDSTLVIGLLGADGVTNVYADFEVWIDGVNRGTYSENNQMDAISDGSNDNARGAMAIYFNQLGYASHKVKVINKGAGFFILDYFGHLVDIQNATPLLIMEVPKMDATGYATSPNAASDAVMNAMNASLDSLVLTMPAGYPVFVGKTNDNYNVATGLDPADHIHPNNLGHRQIFTAARAAIPANVTSLPIGTIGVGADSYLFASKNGVKTKLAFLDDVGSGGSGATKPLDSVLVAGATIPARTITLNGALTISGNRTNVDSLKAGSVYIGDNPAVTTSVYSLGFGKVTANGNPYIYWKNQSAAANEKLWDMYNTGTDFYMRALNDDGSAGATAFQINKTGSSVNYTKFFTTLWVSGGSIKFPDNTLQSTAFTGNQFSSATGGIYYNTGALGVGTNTPYDATFTPALRVGAASGGVNLDIAGPSYARIWFRATGEVTDKKNYEILNLNQIFSISRANDAASSRTYRFVIADNGNVGIGNNNAPNYMLDVAGSVGAAGTVYTTGSNAGFQIARRDNNANSFMMFSLNGNLDLFDVAGNTTRVYMTPAGLFKYAADMSGSYDDRTMVDKGYMKNASNLATGTVPTARLGSNTASSTTYLRGDQSWQPISGLNTSPYHGKQEDDVITLSTLLTTLQTISIPDNTSGIITCWIQGMRQSSLDTYTRQIIFRVKKVSGTLTVGTPSETLAVQSETGTAGSTVTVANSSGSVVVQVTPGTASAIEWKVTTGWVFKGSSL